MQTNTQIQISKVRGQKFSDLVTFILVGASESKRSHPINMKLISWPIYSPADISELNIIDTAMGLPLIKINTDKWSKLALTEEKYVLSTENVNPIYRKEKTVFGF